MSEENQKSNIHPAVDTVISLMGLSSLFDWLERHSCDNLSIFMRQKTNKHTNALQSTGLNSCCNINHTTRWSSSVGKPKVNYNKNIDKEVYVWKKNSTMHTSGRRVGRYKDLRNTATFQKRQLQPWVILFSSQIVWIRGGWEPKSRMSFPCGKSVATLSTASFRSRWCLLDESCLLKAEIS